MDQHGPYNTGDTPIQPTAEVTDVKEVRQRFSTKRGDLSGGILEMALLLRRGRLDRPVLHDPQDLLVTPGQLDRRYLQEAGQQ